ncbi:MAG: hypothetical protein K1W17_08085 [Oscillospiraceae bacterium]
MPIIAGIAPTILVTGTPASDGSTSFGIPCSIRHVYSGNITCKTPAKAAPP